jgi:hypothetical protein
MAKFVYIYTGGSMPESEEEGKAVMAKWDAFLGGMGDHVTDVGNPFGASKSVNGGATSGASGYSIVDAGSLDEAATHAKGCPILERGGNVEVYEALAM